MLKLGLRIIAAILAAVAFAVVVYRFYIINAHDEFSNIHPVYAVLKLGFPLSVVIIFAYLAYKGKFFDK